MEYLKELTLLIITKTKINKVKLSLSDFNKFVKEKEDTLQGKDLLKEFEFAKPYIATYSDLLQTFYDKSSFGDTNIFGIVKWA